MAPIASLLVAFAGLAATPSEPPFYAVRNVRLVDRVDAPEVTLILRDGRIEGKVDARAEIPPGAREIDGRGWLALPAFIDAYSHAGCETPRPEAEQDDAPPPTLACAQGPEARQAHPLAPTARFARGAGFGASL